MTEHYDTELFLTEGQFAKIKNALKKKCDATIRISSKNISSNNSNIILPMTKTQISGLQKAMKLNKGLQIKFSQRQLQNGTFKKDGGLLPLLALLPAILAAAGGVTGGIASAVNSSKQTAEQARHNKAIEDIARGSGFVSDAAQHIPIVGKPLSDALKKIGLGGCVNKLVGLKIGTGIYLEPQGEGVHLQPAGGGLHLEPQPY